MNFWQMIASVAAVFFPAMGILNAYLLNQVRLGVADLRLQMLEARQTDRKEITSWVEAEFLRKEAARERQDAARAVDRRELSAWVEAEFLRKEAAKERHEAAMIRLGALEALRRSPDPTAGINYGDALRKIMRPHGEE